MRPQCAPYNLPSPRPLPARPAFTLAELLVAMTIMALLTASIVSATRAIAGTRASVDERVARSAAARQALEAVVAALRNVRRDPDRDRPLILGRAKGPGDERIDLQVISDTRARPDGEESDQYDVSFYLWQREEDGVQVLLCRRKNALTDRPGEGGIATVVAEGITALSFQYCLDGEWQSEWLETETSIPEAVRVTVAAVGNPPRRMGKPLAPAMLSTVVPIHANPPAELALPAPAVQPATAGQPASPDRGREAR